jgi:hypothetical protein
MFGPLKVALSLIVGCGLLFTAQKANALDSQFYPGTGMLNATVGGAQVQPISVAPVLDAELEFFSSPKTANMVHMTLATDASTAQMKYFSTAYGRRHYLWGTTGARVSEAGSDGNIEYFSKQRYFLDWEVGVGQMQGSAITNSLSYNSTMLEFGGAFGMVHQFSRDFGFHARVGIGYGYGFTSVALTALITRFVFGVSYFF